MTKHMHRIYRRVAPLLAAGMLLQAGGCTFDFNSLTAGLLNSILTNLLTSIIFGAFNLATI